MSRFSLGSLFFGTVFATAAASLSLAAAGSSTPSDTSALVKDREAHCAENPAPGAEATAPGAEAQQGPGATACESQAEQDDRSYLVATARPGDTMSRQGPQTAIARLNPEFVTRLASAIRDARQSGLPSAGIFSAYRPPVYGVGGFSDKFRSLHSYGLAVDMTGIGEPGSKDAKLWHEIAGRHGVFCPYGPNSKTEWNHCQATPMKVVVSDNPLRKTITGAGPISLEKMFKVGESIIDNLVTSVASIVNRREDTDVIRHHMARTARVAASQHVAASERLGRKHVREAHNVATRAKRGEKTKMVVVAANLRHEEKSHRKTQAEAKLHEPRKSARGSEGRRDSTRHRSHLA